MPSRKASGELYISPIDCSKVSALSADDTTALVQARLTATVQGIAGWIRAVRLNEDLKEAAIPVQAGEIAQGKLAQTYQEFGETERSWQWTKAKDGQAQMKGHGADINGNNGLSAQGSWPADHKDSGIQNSPGLTTFFDNFKNEKGQGMSQSATANILAFSGGGSKTTYTTSMTGGESLQLAFTTDSGLEWNAKASIEGAVAVFSAGVDGGGGGHSGGNTPTLKKKNTLSHSHKTTTAFTLNDNNIGDYYDVKVSRDAVYNTPVFKTLAGRSSCPHEPGTDPREAFNVVFADAKSLDYEDEKTYSKVRNVARQQNGDASRGTCASFFIEVVNETPYADNLQLLMKLTTGYEKVATLGETTSLE